VREHSPSRSVISVEMGFDNAAPLDES